MSKLPELLKQLGRQAETYEKYRADPRAVMEKYQCTEEEIKAMLSKDLEAVKRLSGMQELTSNHTIRTYD
ncbi:MAG: hypothetical protein RQ741_06440 [Wenzhouxiangellaceae bacterium]|nr:hypothetical protein [Wenzhouxiangellaceae bacterium]